MQNVQNVNWTKVYYMIYFLLFFLIFADSDEKWLIVAIIAVYVGLGHIALEILERLERIEKTLNNQSPEQES